jgi:hypothetical protein
MKDKRLPDHDLIRIVKKHHDPRAKEESDKVAWDYSIYPDLNSSQRKAFEDIGATLYMIQMAEQAIKLAITFILHETTNMSLDDFASAKRTLGQLLHEVRKTSDLHTQFDDILDGFLKKRNVFVHEIFSSADYGLESEEKIQQLQAFVNDIQDHSHPTGNGENVLA